METPKNALLSVYHKAGIVEFARRLIELGWRLFASGGTARELIANSVPVTDVADLVGSAILRHRVVTLSREIHAGLLADPEIDLQELESLGLPYISLVCVDLYPLEAEIASPTATRDSVIEKTDIGGPTMLRSAAKGRRIVIAEPSDREYVLDFLNAAALVGDDEEDQLITALCAKAEFIVSTYCLASARYHSSGAYDGILGKQVQVCKYGENGHQTPAHLFMSNDSDPLSLANFTLMDGTEPSYNNICDMDRLLQTMTHIAAVFHKNLGSVPYIAVGAKHGNPCGAAIAENPQLAIEEMVTGDTRAIFGGLVMTNFTLTDSVANALLTHGQGSNGKRLLDAVIAPKISSRVLPMFARKEGKCRIFANPALASLNDSSLDTARRFRYVRGGFLAQPNYTFVLDFSDPGIETIGPPLEQIHKENLMLAWAIGSTSNSNTITLTNGRRLIGNGVGQQDRVGAAKLALMRARDALHDTLHAAAYSDSFFPFPDGPKELIDAGISAILATSGSRNDRLTKELCDKNNISLVMIPDSAARGFFGH